MSNYRFIMRTEDSVVSNEDGRLILEDRDEWAKTEYDTGVEEYAGEQSRMEEAADYNG